MIFPAGNTNPSLSGSVRRASVEAVSWLELVDNPWSWSEGTVSLKSGLELVVDSLHLRPLLSPLPEAFDLYVKASNHGLYYYDGVTEFQLNLNGFSGSWLDLSDNPWLLGPSEILLLNQLGLRVKSLIVGTPEDIVGQIQLSDGPKPDLGTLSANNLYASGGNLWFWNGLTETQLDLQTEAVHWADILDNPWVTTPLPPASFLVSLPNTHRLSFHTAYAGGVDNVPAFHFYPNQVPVSSNGMFWYDGADLRFNRVGTVVNITNPTIPWANISGNPWSLVALPGGQAVQLPDDNLLSIKSALVGGLANSPAFTFLPNLVAAPASGMLWWTGTALNFRDGGTTRNLLDRSWGSITGNPWAYFPGAPINYMSLPIDHVITADFFIGGYHATRPSFRMQETNPATPVDGDWWYHAGDFKARADGQTVNLTQFLKLLAIAGTEIGLFPGYTLIAGGTAPPLRLTASPDAASSSPGDLWNSSDDGHLKFKDGIIDRNISFPRGDIAAVTLGETSVDNPVEDQWYTCLMSISNFNYGQLVVDLANDGIEVLFSGVYQVTFSAQFSQTAGAQEDVQFRLVKNAVPGPAVNLAAFFARTDIAISETVSTPLDAGDTVYLQFRSTAAGLTNMTVATGGFFQITTVRHI